MLKVSPNKEGSVARAAVSPRLSCIFLLLLKQLSFWIFSTNCCLGERSSRAHTGGCESTGSQNRAFTPSRKSFIPKNEQWLAPESGYIPFVVIDGCETRSAIMNDLDICQGLRVSIGRLLKHARACNRKFVPVTSANFRIGEA